MSEKRYLLTQDEICQLQDIALSALSWENREDFEMVKHRQDEYRAMLESHEYRERTCEIIVRGTWLYCSFCRACVNGGYSDATSHYPMRHCPSCGAKVVGE